jgi:hypothetical protein
MLRPRLVNSASQAGGQLSPRPPNTHLLGLHLDQLVASLEDVKKGLHPGQLYGF